MEKAKELNRFCQIKDEITYYADFVKEFANFYKRGENKWCEENLSSNDFYHLKQRYEKRKRKKFEIIQEVRGKSLHECDFQDFMKKNGLICFPKKKKKN